MNAHSNTTTPVVPASVTRRQAFKSLASGAAMGFTGAVIVSTTSCAPTEAPAAGLDPMDHLVGAINSNWQHAESLNGDETAREAFTEEVMAPLWRNLYRETPETTTTDGAAAALRYVLSLGNLEAEDEAVVRSVAAFLERGIS